MHELSLVENLRELIEAEARRLGWSRVKTVRLAVGKLSCILPEALEFCFDAVMAGSLAEGSKLEILSVAGRGRCPSCGQIAEMAELYDLCPECQLPLTVVQGLEIVLQELEVT